MRRIQQIVGRLLAAQTQEEAFRLLTQLRSPGIAIDAEHTTPSESQRVAEHAYRAVGRHEGTVIVVSMLLAQRFGPLTEETKAGLEELNIFQLRDIAERLFTAQSLDEALDVDCWPASGARAVLEVFGPE